MPKHNLELFEINSNLNEFDFDFVNSYAFAYSNYSVSVDLSTKPRKWNNIDFGHVECDSPEIDVCFEFGADKIIKIVSSGSIINPNDYDLCLDTSIQIKDFGYDLNLAEGGVSFIFSSKYDTYNITIGEHVECNITLERNRKENNITLCEENNNVILLNYDNVICNSDFSNDGFFDGVELKIDLSFDVDGKNRCYDILLCPDEINPDINNVEPHIFIYDEDFLTKTCSEFEVIFEDGVYCETQLQPDRILGTVVFEDGVNTSTQISTSQLLDSTFYTGEISLINLDVPENITFDLNCYSGELLESNISTTSLFNLDFYEGSTTTFEILTFESKEFEVIFEDGVYSNVSFSTSSLIDFTLHTGENSTFELDLPVNPNITLDLYIGEILDFNISVTQTFNPTIDVGEISDVNLSVESTFEIDCYSGETFDIEFSNNPPKELDNQSYSGEELLVDLSIIRSLFPRGHSGELLLSELETHEKINIDCDSYVGEYVDTEISEAPFNSIALTGENVSLTFGTSINIPSDSYVGEYVSFELNRSPSFEPIILTGSSVELEFTVPEGESINVIFEDGVYSNVTVETQESAILTPNIIISSQHMRDGQGGLGAINHCVLSFDDLDPINLDNILRLGFDELNITNKLNFEFTDFGDAPWNVCKGVGQDVSIDLSTEPRIDLQFDTGESIQTSIPFDTINLDFETINSGELINYCWEPQDTTRFCKGYILPNGNSVVLEFGFDTEIYDCSQYTIYSGEYSYSDLSIEYDLETSFDDGIYAYATLTVDERITILFTTGENMFAPSEAVIEASAYDGLYLQTQFEELPIDGSTGESMFIDGLIVAGPGVEWKTPDGCLDNQYLPLTENGDIDIELLETNGINSEHFPKVPVENKNYIHILNATCVSFVETDDES